MKTKEGTREYFEMVAGVQFARWMGNHPRLFWLLLFLVIIGTDMLLSGIYGYFGWNLPPGGMQ